MPFFKDLRTIYIYLSNLVGSTYRINQFMRLMRIFFRFICTLSRSIYRFLLVFIKSIFDTRFQENFILICIVTGDYRAKQNVQTCCSIRHGMKKKPCVRREPFCWLLVAKCGVLIRGGIVCGVVMCGARVY